MSYAIIETGPAGRCRWLTWRTATRAEVKETAAMWRRVMPDRRFRVTRVKRENPVVDNPEQKRAL